MRTKDAIGGWRFANNGTMLVVVSFSDNDYHERWSVKHADIRSAFGSVTSDYGSGVD